MPARARPIPFILLHTSFGSFAVLFALCRMMKAVKTAIRDADALLAIIDASDRPDEALEMVQPAEGASLPPMGVLLNKVGGFLL